MLVVFDDIILQLKWHFYYYKESKVLKKDIGVVYQFRIEGTKTSIKYKPFKQ